MRTFSQKPFHKHFLFKKGIVFSALFASASLQLVSGNMHFETAPFSIIASAAAAESALPAETAPAQSAHLTAAAPKKVATPVKPPHGAAPAAKHPVAPKKTGRSGPAKAHSAHKNIKAPPTLSMPMPASTKSLSKAEVKLLLQARAAYWHRNAPKAIADYQKLLHEAPDHPGIYGELGNVYYMTGKYPEAAIAYGSAARTMIRMQRFAEAYSLLPLISSLNPREATAIDHSLQVHSAAAAKKTRATAQQKSEQSAVPD
ncbi:tetratricopeptide repeat protein [Acidithiobacillus sp. HP-6]|uniref:tetratricopeptide repeat protein n=1 Tax=unclassified Acidithiobacillus TaxID=2614800 RepID=UPI00187A533B|nr:MULTISPECIES: tetratricopeptide repeat protein [unclassified Acidithiobacillus]MBE7562296.1 tetratricopeptide repeat protein [Acidithiobacillus sp. HP-6]MBE7569021.1 tetratricopeptide repeat protein [Acidithiobacillus sp. HP-2]MDD2749859.1 tetratricopeptide repeat protein [Acidithiobacillus sp.]MDD5279412.1 tetratricopeptide repeat protein [Acidithiobacillus sp.]